jgi:DsbC/DsbD-like thiol-disulfide interchange protein
MLPRIGFLIAFLAVVPASAQTPRTARSAHTTIEILAASATVEPGTDTWIGVRFLLEPGWHIYWRNPGDSGAPPILLWTTPAGVTIGDVEWPAPERIPYGSLVNYGYHGDVILPMLLTSTARLAGPITLAADWMVCRDVCVRAKARVALTFPVAPSAAVSDWAARLAEARRRVPVALPKGWRAAATAGVGRIDIRVEAPAALASALFFPIDEHVLDVSAAPVVTPSARGVRLRLATSEQLATMPARLRGVLVVPDGAAYELDMPMAAQGAAPGK